MSRKDPFAVNSRMVPIKNKAAVNPIPHAQTISMIEGKAEFLLANISRHSGPNTVDGNQGNKDAQ